MVIFLILTLQELDFFSFTLLILSSLLMIFLKLSSFDPVSEIVPGFGILSISGGNFNGFFFN